MRIQIVRLRKLGIDFYGIVRGRHILQTALSKEALITAIWKFKRDLEAHTQAALEAEAMAERKKLRAQGKGAGKTAA